MNEPKTTTFFDKLQRGFHRFGHNVKQTGVSSLQGFVHWIDPKLDKYRSTARRSARNTVPPVASKSDNYQFAKEASSEIPQTRADILAIIGSAPIGVFTKDERKLVESVLNLPVIKVEEIMQPKSRIVYVDIDETLGPLTLDHLYRTGLQHFPVQDRKSQLVGLIHTSRLNALEVREQTTAADILDPGLYYVRSDYTLRQALDVFLRNNAFYLLVVDKFGKIVGFLTLEDFYSHIFGKTDTSFNLDNDRLAVAKRVEIE